MWKQMTLNAWLLSIMFISSYPPPQDLPLIFPFSLNIIWKDLSALMYTSSSVCKDLDNHHNNHLSTWLGKEFKLPDSLV